MNTNFKTLVLKRSNRLFCFYAISTLLAIVAVFFMDMPSVIYQCMIGLYVLMAAGFYYYRHFSRVAVRKIRLYPNGKIDLESDAKIWRNVRPLPSSRVYAFCVVLNFKEGIFKHQVIILPNSLDPENFRALKVHLRFIECE